MTSERTFTYTLGMINFRELADTKTIGEYLIRHKESTYLLEVDSNTLEVNGIHAGDMVLFERSGDTKQGDIVVILTQNGYSIERFSEVRRVSGEKQIIGVVTASFRTYV